MKAFLKSSAHASGPLHPSGTSTLNSSEYTQALGHSNTTRDTLAPNSVLREVVPRAAVASSSGLRAEERNSQPSALESLSSRLALQDQSARPPTAAEAVKKPLPEPDAVASHFSAQARSGESPEDPGSNRAFIAAEEEVQCPVQQQSLPQSAAIGVASTVLTKQESTEPTEQTLASCSDFGTSAEPPGASLNSFHTTRCPLFSKSYTVLPSKTAKNELDLMGMSKVRAPSALPLHDEDVHSDAKNINELSNSVVACLAPHESVGTGCSGTKKRPQAQQMLQQSRPPLHIQQALPQQQQPCMLQGEHQWLNLPAQHTFRPLVQQQQQLSKMDAWQSSVPYQEQTIAKPESPACSANLQQPQQLLTGHVLVKGTSQAHPVSVNIELFDKGNASNRQLSQVPTHRTTQQLACSLPVAFASYERVVTNDPAAPGGQVQGAQQQAKATVQSSDSTMLQMTAEDNTSKLHARIPLPGTFGAPVCDVTCPAADLPAHSKRPKTADVGEANFASAASSVSFHVPPSTLQTADRGMPLCCSTDPADGGDVSHAGKLRSCVGGVVSSGLCKETTSNQYLDTAQESTATSTSTAGNNSEHHYCFGDLFASAATKNATFGGFCIPFCTLQCQGTNPYVCPEASRCNVNSETGTSSTHSLNEVACATVPNQYGMEVDCSVTKPLTSGKVQETQHRVEAHADADKACTCATSVITDTSQVGVSKSLCQDTTGRREPAVPYPSEVVRAASYFTETSKEGGPSECAVSGGNPFSSVCATDRCRTGSASASSSRGFHSSQFSTLAEGEVSCEAPAVSAMEQRWTSNGDSTRCTRATVELDHKVGNAKSEKEHGSAFEGRIHWGKKRGPYDRPMRILLTDDAQAYPLRGKEQATTKCQVSEGRGDDEKRFAVTAKSTHMAAEPGSSSSMASTRATTPVTCPSNAGSSSTSSAGEHSCAPEAVAVLPSFAAVPSSNADNIPSSPINPQTQAAAETQASSQAPRRRLVRLCDSDEEIWNEWEGQSMLGEGVYGRVYLVRSRKTGEERAFKRMYLQISRFASSRSNEAAGDAQEGGNSSAGMPVANGGLPAVVQREIASLKALQGVRNVIPLEEVFIGSRRVYLSFPVIRGGSLSELLRRYAIWQEHLLTTHQTASSACTSTSPGENRRPTSSMEANCDSSGGIHGCRSESSHQCYEDITSDCCNISRGSGLASTRRDRGHPTRWDCPSSGRCDCSKSNTTSETIRYSDSQSASIRYCRCCAKVTGNATQKRHLLPADVLQDTVCSTCGREAPDNYMHSIALDGVERELTAGAVALKEKIGTGGHCPAPENPVCHSSNQVGQMPRRSSTCSGKKEDEYPCCRSHACGDISSSLTASTRTLDSNGASLTRCPSGAAGVCSRGCCTLRHGMEEETDNEFLNASLQAPCSTFASSLSHSSSLTSAFCSVSRRPRLSGSRSFFPPPFSYPHMPPCGLPLPLAKSIIQAILRGVTACHERRIAHRDMKPDNILLDWVPQAPPSPPPPPPSPVSNQCTSPCCSEQICCCMEQTRSCTKQHPCCTDQTGCCNKRCCYAFKRVCRCDKVDRLPNEEGTCASKQTRRCSGQCRCGAQQNESGCLSLVASSNSQEGAPLSGPAAAGGNKPTCALDVCKAARALLLQRVEAVRDGAARPKPGQAAGCKDMKATSENGTARIGKADEEEANLETYVDREVKSIAEGFFRIEGQQKDTESSGRTGEKPGACGKKREPSFCGASRDNGHSAGSRRRRCTQETGDKGDCEEEVGNTDQGRAADSLGPKAPAANSGDAADADIAAAATTLRTHARIGAQCDGSGAEVFCFPDASVEGHNSTWAAAPFVNPGARDCGPHSNGTAKASPSETEKHPGTTAVATTSAAERDKRSKCQRKGDEAPETGNVEGESCAVGAVAGATEDDDGDGSNGSTSSGTAVAEEQEEASSDTQQSVDSLSMPEYPPQPTRLVIADFGLARTLPFHIPVSASAALTPPSHRTRQKQRQRCRHKHQQPQFVLPATAAVPTTRYTSSCSNSCWVGYTSGCCAPCIEVQDKKKRLLGNLPVRSHSASACSTTPPAAQEASSHESHAEDPLPAADGCKGRCKHLRSGQLEKWCNQKSATTLLGLSCDGTTCSETAAENASYSWWMQCNFAFKQPQGPEESCSCCCRDASPIDGNNSAGRTASPGVVTPSKVEEADKTEETPEEQAEEDVKENQSTHQLFVSPASTPLYSSATFCLSPEIITLNYRPLDVLLGSSSYSLGVDVWSVGCIFMELLTGCELIDGCTEFQCIVAIMKLFGNPWKKAKEDHSKKTKRSPCIQGIRNDRCVGGVDFGERSCSCDSEIIDSLPQCHGVSESGRGHSKGKKPVVPCEEAVTALTCCCCAPPEGARRAAGKAQSTSSRGGKRMPRGNTKPAGRCQLDSSSEWRFWSEALPAFEGEDRPLERILRECGRLDAVADPHLLDLASRLLTVLPDRRITASEALLHPFFDDVRVEDEL